MDYSSLPEHGHSTVGLLGLTKGKTLFSHILSTVRIEVLSNFAVKGGRT